MGLTPYLVQNHELLNPCILGSQFWGNNSVDLNYSQLLASEFNQISYGLEQLVGNS